MIIDIFVVVTLNCGNWPQKMASSEPPLLAFMPLCIPFSLCIALTCVNDNIVAMGICLPGLGHTAIGLCLALPGITRSGGSQLITMSWGHNSVFE